MKKLIPAIAALVVSASAVTAQEMEFKSMVIDYGKIKRGDNSEKVVMFTNAGKEDLVIRDAKGSTGSLVVRYPTGAIAPGASGEIKVRYDTNREGPINKKVIMWTNSIGGDGSGIVTLTVKGEVLRSNINTEQMPVPAR